MRAFLLIAGLVLGTPALAVVNGNYDLSSTNLLTSYSTAAPQQALTGLPVGTPGVLTVINTSAGEICCVIEQPSTTSAPSSNAGNELCTPAGLSRSIDFIPVVKNVYCRSNSGSTLSTGKLLVDFVLQKK